MEKIGYHRDIIRREERKANMALLRTGYQPAEEKSKPAAFAMIPYVAGTTERISRVLGKRNVVTRFNCVSKTRSLLVRAKDRVPMQSKSGVYEVTCSCGSSYIGQTSRSLKCRLMEHQRATKNRQFRLSAIADHIWTGPTHNINFDEAKLISKERRYFPRLIREAIEISKTKDNFNREDGYPLPHAWKRVLRGKRNSSDSQSQVTQPERTDI